MKTYTARRTITQWLEKTVTVPDDMHIDDVAEYVWEDEKPWDCVGSRSVNFEIEPE